MFSSVLKGRLKPQGYKLIRDGFIDTTSRLPEKVGFLEKRPGMESFREITYKEFRSDVTKLGAALIEELGLKGKRIAIIGENSYEWAAAYYAVTCGAGTVVPLDKELPAEEVLNLINRSHASAIFYSPRKRDIIEKIKDRADSLECYIQLYEDENTVENKTEKDYTFEGLVKLGDKYKEEVLLEVPIDEDEFKILLFTSGTTAASKGVMLSNKNIMSNVIAALEAVSLTEEDRFFSVLPLHHTYEASIGMVIPVSCGMSIGYAGGLKSIANDLKDLQPSIMLVVPALIESLIKKVNKTIDKQGKTKVVDVMSDVTNAFGKPGRCLKKIVFKDILAALGGKVRIIVSAAAPIDPLVGKRIEDFGISFLQGYGLTETAPLATIVPSDKRNPASVGRAGSCTEIKIDNPNEDGIGEVLIRGTNLTMGYYEDEEETKRSIVDGWFHSGDLGYIDEEGFLFLTGRCKNLIITGNGKNVYPEEIEALINKCEIIKESMIYQTENAQKDDTILAAIIVPDFEKVKEKFGEIRDEDLKEKLWEEVKNVNKQLVSYKYVKQIEVRKEELEKTTTLKIKRYLVK